jgi:hypothetical protein
MVRLGQRGVSDIVAIAFMFIILVIAAVLVHGFTLGSLHAAADRQSELKVEYLRETLQRSTVNPYGVPALEAAAQQLVLEEPVVNYSSLDPWMENTLGYLCPLDHGIELRLSYDDNNLLWVYPSNKVKKGEEFVRRGNVTATKTGGGIVSVEIEIRMFEIYP